MILSLININNRLTVAKRLFTAVTVFFVCHSPFTNAFCNSEILNTRQIAKRIANEWPLRPSQDGKTQYVQKLADYIIFTIKHRMETRTFDWPHASWKFLLMRDLSVNAYSIGNGNVYLTDGTFTFVETEAELAAIIAHEIAHQLIGHFCQNDEEHATHRIGSLVQILDNNKEIEADALAVDILHKTYYPAQAMLDIVKRLPTLMEGSMQKRLRINSLERKLKGIRAKSFSSSPEFLRIKQHSDDNYSFD